MRLSRSPKPSMSSVQKDSHASVDGMHFCTLSSFFGGQNNDDLNHSAVRNDESD